MKKVVSILTIIMLVACSMLGVVSAKSQDGSIGYHEIVSFVKYSTEGKFHTSIKSSNVINGTIKVENTIQRKNSSGTWVNKANGFFYMSYANQISEINYDLKTTDDTRTLWLNETQNSFLQGRFYINSGNV